MGLQRWPFDTLVTLELSLLAFQVTDADKAEVARRERERLRLQAKHKKEQLEKLRDQQNDDTATGEVSACQHLGKPICTQPISLLPQSK